MKNDRYGVWASRLFHPKTLFLLVVFTTVARRADACQICAVTSLYNGFRFGAVWFYLFVAWTVAALIADNQISQDETIEKPGTFLFSRSPLKLLVVIIVLFVFPGVHFLALFYFPFILFRYCKPRSFWRKRPRSENVVRKYAPAWFRKTSLVTLILLFVSIVPSYYILPLMLNEPQARSLCSGIKRGMAGVAPIVERYLEEFGEYPPVGREERDGETYLTLDTNELVKIGSFPKEEELKALLVDPFAVRFRRVWFSDGAVFAFIGLFRGLYPCYTKDPDMFNNVQYYHDESGFVLWGRGPDGDFDVTEQYLENLGSIADMQDIDAIVGVLYDPTNGTISNGDILRWSFRAKEESGRGGNKE